MTKSKYSIVDELVKRGYSKEQAQNEYNDALQQVADGESPAEIVSEMGLDSKFEIDLY